MDDVFSKGYICPKGSSLKGLHEDPDRITTPLVKVGGNFEPIGWDDAAKLIDERLAPLLGQHGKDAVALYSGNPWSHNYETIIYTSLLYRTIGKNRFAAASLDQRPREIVSSVHFGTRTAFPVPDMDRTNLLILIGSDPMESNGSLATAPDWPGRLKALRQRGGRLVVIDPRRSKTAEIADEHLFIIPGTDAALLAGVANTLFAEGLVNPGRAGQYVDGLEDVGAALGAFTPEAVSPMCGIAPEQIRALARQIAAAKSAVVHGRLGTCLQDLATLTAWLIDVVNTATGNLDREGGAMFSRAAAMGSNTTGQPGSGSGTDYGTFHSRLRQLPGAFNQLPSVCLAEEIETPGEGQIRGLITIAGNPVLSAPDSDRLADALDSLEFMVCLDMYVNETTRHADLILPAPSALERSHYDVSYYQFSLRNIANYSPAVLPLADGLVPEWRTILMLAGILQGRGPQPDVDAMDTEVASWLVSQAVGNEHSPAHGRAMVEIMAELTPHIGPERILDLNLRIGPYGDGFGSRPDGLSLAKLMDHPHGIDLGALEPRMPEMLRTPNGRIDLATPAFIADLDRLSGRLDVRRPPLVLIGRRHLRSNNSWQHNIPTLMKGKPRFTLQVNPIDATRLKLDEGCLASIRSDVATIEAPVEIADTVMSGVVSLPHGWGHDLPGVRLSVAAERPGANANRLASNDHVDPLSGNPHLNGIAVQISRVPRTPQASAWRQDDTVRKF